MRRLMSTPVPAAALAVSTLALVTVPAASAQAPGASRNGGPQWIGALSEGVWSGSSAGFDGEGVIVGVIDSGIEYAHQHFGNAGFLDLDRDGRTDVALGSGPANTVSIVTVFNQDGDELFSFEPFGPGWVGGVTVATGNVGGNKRPELVTTTQTNFGQLNFHRFGGKQLGFLIPVQGFTGGVDALAAQLVKGGRDELLVVPRSQTNTIQILDAKGNAIVPGGFTPAGKVGKGGLETSIAHTSVGIFLLVSRIGSKDKFVSVYKFNPEFRTNGSARVDPFEMVNAFRHGLGGKGVHLAAADVDEDGDDEVIVGARARKKQSIRIFELDGTLLAKHAPFAKPAALSDLAAAPFNQ